jgi:hypothetical protein
MTNQVVVSAERSQPTPTIGGVFAEALSFVAYGARALGNTAKIADSISYSGVVMAEGFAKISAVEQDLKLREATALLAIKTQALNAKLGLAVEAPIQPPVKPALQM